MTNKSVAAEKCALIALAIAYCVLNFPGHFTPDSVMHLTEGISGNYVSFHPPFVSWLIGKSYSWLGSTGPYVALVIAMLFGFVWFLHDRLAARASRVMRLVLLLFLVSPLPLLYSGLVWKDVLIAHLGLATFALAYLYSKRGSTGYLISSLFFCGLLLLIRQHGFVMVLLYVPVLAYREGLSARTVALRGVGFFAIAVAISLVVFKGVQLSSTQMTDSTIKTGVQILRTYDIAGAVSHDQEIDLKPFFPPDFPTDDLVAEMRSKYSAERVEYLLLSPRFFSGLTPENIQKIWTYVATKHPIAYASHRLDFFSYMLGLRDENRCLPVLSGWAADPPFRDALEQTDLRPSPFSHQLATYAKAFVPYGLFTPAIYFGMGTLAFGILLWLGIKSTWPFLLLDASGLLYGATFAIIGIACDFRYTYYMVITSTFCLIYALSELFGRNKSDQKQRSKALA